MANKLPPTLAMLAWPALGFPIFFALSTAHDTLAGDRLLLFILKHDSRSELLWTTLSDWAHALPLSYVLAGTVGAAVYVWRRRFARYSSGVLIGLSAGGCALAAWLATGQFIPLAWIAALSGAFWAGSLAVVYTWLIKLKR
jgi:hypothetical protein